MTESLVAVKNEKVCIRMLNSSMNPVKISENTIISNLYEINSHDNVFFYNENSNNNEVLIYT